jgi:hypothetical protein
MPDSSPLPHPVRQRRRHLKPRPRYYAVVDLVYHYRCLTASQIQPRLFSEANASGCQRTLNTLTAFRWIDRLSRDSINHPYVYTLSPRSTVGNRLMRDKYGEEDLRAHMFKPGPIQHFLAINDVRLWVQGHHTPDPWLYHHQLARLFGPSAAVLPDAYFRISHRGQTTGHFMELQHGSRTHRVLLSKLDRYRSLFQRQGFLNRSMLVLVVFTTHLNRTGEQRVAQALAQTPLEKYPFARFLSLDQMKNREPKDLLENIVCTSFVRK